MLVVLSLYFPKFFIFGIWKINHQAAKPSGQYSI